ncbi:unnamed protein product [Symbiodinium sp. CCMP2456]|nr:unnamed protein product [Symbiodinium sp. CCMP2456]
MEPLDPGRLGFGLVALDLECIHDHIHGSYAAMNWHETRDQSAWKARSQIIELAAVNLATGESLLLRSRPEFSWNDVKSAATRLFAEHSGHKAIVCDASLPLFAQLWPTQVVPFLQRAAGVTGKVVLIAHNGDRFDHYVLSKEISRLGLDMGRCPRLVSADTVATLKKRRLGYGHVQQLYGQPGSLALQQLYMTFVPEKQRAAGLQQHQALDDVRMMCDVIAFAPYLAPLLAQDIVMAAHGAEIPAITHAVWQRLLYPEKAKGKGGGSSAATDSSTAGTKKSGGLARQLMVWGDAWNWGHGWSDWWGPGDYWAWGDTDHAYAQPRAKDRANRNRRRNPRQPVQEESASSSAMHAPAPDAPKHSAEKVNWQ